MACWHASAETDAPFDIGKALPAAQGKRDGYDALIAIVEMTAERRTRARRR
jgi:hypothetical protein